LSSEPGAPGTAAAEERFFAGLPEIHEFPQVVDQRHYTEAPSSWHVLLTDVRGSTKAIEAGRYKDVNALGVASIVAIRNAIPDLELPYVFGGDGATLLVPGSRLAPAEVALRGVQKLAREAFALDLRVGAVPVADLRAAGHAVRVGRYRASPQVCFAMLAGTGFTIAEGWLKDPGRGARYLVSGQGAADASFEGFECRWQPVDSRRGTIASLLVSALPRSEPERAQVYRAVISRIEQVIGGGDSRPLSLRGLRLGGLGGDYSTEARVRSGQASGSAFAGAHARARKGAFVGRVLLGLRARAGSFDGAQYRREVIDNSDFRKFDETLRMVLDLAEAELQKIVAFLDAEHGSGRVAYGVHRSSAALVTCFVRSYAGDHLHFVDGADGGYALAARQLKGQLAGRGSPPDLATAR